MEGGVDLGETGGRRELEGMEGDKTVAGIYCVREESIFQ